MDVIKFEDLIVLVVLVKWEFGGIDVIFNNVGIMLILLISVLKIDEWNVMIDVNLKGVLNGVVVVMFDFIN